MKRSFTLVELLITVIIIGVLATFVVPAFINAINNSNAKKCRVNVEQLHKAIERFGYEKGNLPTVAEFNDMTEMLFYGAESTSYNCPKYSAANHEYYIEQPPAGHTWDYYLAYDANATVVRGRPGVHKDKGGNFYFRSTKNDVEKIYY